MTAETALRQRVSKQRWAEPGSAHDWLVKWTKIILPSAVGVLIAVLAVAPLGKKSDVSFVLDKKKVENAPERMRVEAARYSGTDDKGQMFVMIANRAIQRSSEVPIVDINGIQQKVTPDEVLNVPQLAGEPGARLTFDKVLLVGNGEKISLGQPTVKGASVAIEILEHLRGPKLRIFKFKRRREYRKRRGHRGNDRGAYRAGG